MRYIFAVFILFGAISGNYLHVVKHKSNAKTGKPQKEEKDETASFNEQLDLLLLDVDNAESSNIEERSILIKNKIFKPIFNQVLNMNRFPVKHTVMSKNPFYSDTVKRFKEYLFRNAIQNANMSKSNSQNVKVNRMRMYKDEPTPLAVQQMQHRLHLELMKAPILRPNNFRRNGKHDNNPPSAKTNNVKPLKNWAYIDPIFTKKQTTQRPCDKHPKNFRPYSNRTLRSDLQNVIKRIQELDNVKEYTALYTYLKNALRMPEAIGRVASSGNSFFMPAGGKVQTKPELKQNKDCSCDSKQKANNGTISSIRKITKGTSL